ncbi:hypothetical protein [Methanocella arvoryzae]|nr:hypothetical protein [Methanocella arvoryzae]
MSSAQSVSRHSAAIVYESPSRTPARAGVQKANTQAQKLSK